MKFSNSVVFTWGLVSLLALTQGCGGDGGGGFAITPLAPIVKQSLPAGLVPGAVAIQSFSGPSEVHSAVHPNTFTPTTAMTDAGKYITNLFQNYFNPGDGSNVQGYLLSKVTEVDDRAALFNGASSSDHKCMAATAAPFTLDFSLLNPTDTTNPNMLKYTLANTQCIAPFSGAGGTAGSGEVFGVNGTNTSEWVTLTDMAGDNLTTGGAFIEMANLSNAGSTSSATPETVTGLAINYSTQAPNVGAFSIAMYKAVQSTNTFEMYYASNQAGVGGFAQSGANGGANEFGPGFRMISDGTNIYADGYLCTDAAGTTCSVTSTVSGGGNTVTGGNWVVFQVCLNATTLAVVDATAVGNCLTLANAFTMSPNSSAYTSSTGIFNGGSPVTHDALTFTNITGDANLGDTYGSSVPVAAKLTAPQLNVLNSLYKTSTASAVATSY